MTDEKGSPKTDTLSLSEMKNVFEEEVRDITRAASLRIRDLAEIVNAYAEGKLTPEEATKRYDRYADKWGEDILPGFVGLTKNATDEEIRADMEKAAEGNRQLQETHKRRARSSHGRGLIGR